MKNKEQIEAYKKMAQEASSQSMEAQIKANLEKTCDKFKGHEDKLHDCIAYLTSVAKEILGGKNGDVADEVCFRICRDYFNDELWAKEDEDKKPDLAKKKAKATKKAEKSVKKTAAEVEKESVAEERERIEKLKEKHSVKAETKFQVCSECGKEFLNLYKGLCLNCYDKKRKAEEAKTPEQIIDEKNRAIVEENNKRMGISMAKPIDLFAEAV